MKKIDARGLSCPAPVLETKAAVESEHPGHIEVLVDNESARQNVDRFLASRGYTTVTEPSGEGHAIIGTSGIPSADPRPAATVPVPAAAGTKIMVMVAADRMGSGDDLLGARLMINFLRTLKEMGGELWRLVFVNSGVKLTIDGAAALEDIQDLEAAGVSILVCGTCLEHFKLMGRKQVGETTNMLDIVTAMQLADKVINL